MHLKCIHELCTIIVIFHSYLHNIRGILLLFNYFWDDPFLYKKSVDGIIRRCIPEHEQQAIIRDCHDSPYGGHHAGVAQQQRYYNLVSIGLLYLKIAMNMLNLVINVKEWEILVGEMKCL